MEMSHEEQIRHMMSQLPPKPRRSKLTLAILMLIAAGAIAIIALSLATNRANASPPPMCFDPENRMSLLCAGTQQYLPPGYSATDPNTWYPCWYSRQAMC